MKNHIMSVANFFIDLAKRENRIISHILMHKLLYLAQGHSWGLYQRAIADEAPEAWKYGPVFPSIYRYWIDEEGSTEVFQEFILMYDDNLGTSVFPPLVQEKEDIELLNGVWNVYKNKDIETISRICQTQDGPWDKVVGQYRNVNIRDEDMKNHFFMNKTS